METASLLREYDTVIGTVTVPADYCSGLLQEFDELMGDGMAVDSPEPGTAFKAVRVKGVVQGRAPVPFTLLLPVAATTAAEAPTPDPPHATSMQPLPDGTGPRNRNRFFRGAVIWFRGSYCSEARGWIGAGAGCS